MSCQREILVMPNTHWYWEGYLRVDKMWARQVRMMEKAKKEKRRRVARRRKKKTA